MSSPQFYTETINQEFAKYIFSMSYEDFKNEVYDSDEVTDDGTKYNLRTYHHLVKKYLGKMIDSGFTNSKVSYKHSKNDIEGRKYVREFGFQSLQKCLRGALCSHTIDYDMNNCHPAILLYVAKRTKLSKCEYSYLTEYVENRNETLKNNDINKLDILININMDTSKTKNKFLIKFNEQLLNLKKTILEQDEYKHITTTNAKNPISSKVNKVLCKIESEILENAIFHFQLKEVTKMFDGFMTTKTIDIADLNDLTVDYGIKWSIKPHNDDLQIGDYELKLTDKQKQDKKIKDKIEQMRQKEADKLLKAEEREAKKQLKAEEKEAERLLKKDEKEAEKLRKVEEAKERKDEYTKQYLDMKEKFEKNNYLVMNPVLYCKDYNDDQNDDVTYSLKLFNEIYAYLQIDTVTNQGHPTKIPFVYEWIKDETRRHYNNRDFYPWNKNECQCPPNTFNTFTPFHRLKNVESFPVFESNEDWDKIPKAKTFIYNYLKPMLMGMCEQDETAVAHVVQTIAHMIQYPEVLQQTILVFKGLPGIGKNTVFELMKSLMGVKYVHCDANIKNVSGDFNGLIEGKLLIMIDEVNQSEFLNYKEKIKALSTTPVLTINKKGVSQYKVKHYATLIMGSNQDKPVTIDNMDRRYLINQGDFSNCKSGTKEKLWKPLYESLLDDDIMDEVFHYFNQMKLNGFDPRNMPSTRAKQELEKDLIKPTYRYLYHQLKQDTLDDIFDINKKNNNMIIVDKKLLRNAINYYMEDMGMTYSITEDTLRNHLSALGKDINQSKVLRLAGLPKPVRRIVFDKVDILEILEMRFFKNQVDEEIEEIEVEAKSALEFDE